MIMLHLCIDKNSKEQVSKNFLSPQIVCLHYKLPEKKSGGAAATVDQQQCNFKWDWVIANSLSR